MGAMVIGALRVDLGMETSAFMKGSSQAQKEAQALAKRMQAVGQKFQSIGKSMTLGITLPLAAMAAQAVKGAKEQAAAVAQVEAALKSMGDVSGKTSAELTKTADALEMRSLFDADVILKQVTANLLTFGNVAGEQFDRAQQAALDMATRLGGEPQAAAIMLGKALNDPVKGISALTRVGVQFTEKQKDMIKALVQSGQTAKAQGIILDEVGRQFNGAAQAAADTAPLRKLEVAWNQAMDKIGDAILPVIPVIADAIAGVASAFAALDPQVAGAVVIFGAIAAALGPVIAAVGALISAGSALAPIFASGGALSGGLAALVPLLGPVAVGVGAIAAAWALFGDKIGPVLSDLKTQLVETLGPPLMELFHAVSSALTELWQGPFGDLLRAAIAALGSFLAAALKTFGTNLISVIKVAIQFVTGVFSTIVDVIKLVANLLTGDFSGAWDAAGRIVTRAGQALLAIFDALAPGAIAAVTKLYNGVKNWISDKLSAIFDSVVKKVQAVGNAFYNLYDAVVGHSYVPDMVDGIAAQMARLDTVMVGVAGKAASKTAETFKALAGEVAPILDRLFPDEARLRTYEKELAILEKAAAAGEKNGGLSTQSADAAKQRLYAEYFQDKFGPIDILGGTDGSLDIDFDKIGDQMQKTIGIFDNELRAPAKKITLEVVNQFADMAHGVIDSLQYMTDAISKGNIFDKIVGVLGLIQQIVGVVVQIKGISGGGGGGGSGASDALKSASKNGGVRAYGGPVVPGKTYRVGERGPEFFSPSTPGYIHPDKGMGARGATYNISGNLLTEEWWEKIRQMDDVAAQKGAMAGANMVQETSARRGRQRLGRGR